MKNIRFIGTKVGGIRGRYYVRIIFDITTFRAYNAIWCYKKNEWLVLDN